MVECTNKELRALASEIYTKITEELPKLPKWVKNKLIDLYNPIFSTLVQLCKEGYELENWEDVFDIHQLDFKDKSTFVRSLRAMLEKLPRRGVEVYELGLVDQFIGDMLQYRARLIDEFYRAKSPQEREEILRAIRDVERQLQELGVKVEPFQPDITKLLQDEEAMKMEAVDQYTTFLVKNFGLPYFEAYRIAEKFVNEHPEYIINLEEGMQKLGDYLREQYTLAPKRVKLPVDELLEYANEIAAKYGATLTPEEIKELKEYIQGALSKMVTNVNEAKKYVQAWVENLLAARGITLRVEKTVKERVEKGEPIPEWIKKAFPGLAKRLRRMSPEHRREIIELLERARQTPPLEETTLRMQAYARMAEMAGKEEQPIRKISKEELEFEEELKRCRELKEKYGIQNIFQAWELYGKGVLTLEEVKLLTLCT